METDTRDAIHNLIRRSKHVSSLSDSAEVRDIVGINKFRRKVKRELQFLEGVLIC